MIPLFILQHRIWALAAWEQAEWEAIMEKRVLIPSVTEKV